jgi:DMSO reductase anchor subunit
MPEEVNKANHVFPPWSLIAFTFLTTAAVSLVCASVISATVSNLRMIIALLAISAIASLFHLRRKASAWRAVFNIRTSPLSREIAMFILFSAVSIISILTGSPVMIVAASISGLALLLVIDSVYAFSDNSVKTRLHAGQTFIIGLVLTSVLSGAVIPFIFLAVIKTGLSLRNIASETRGSPIFTLKFFRIALLLISVAGLVTVIVPGSTIILIMVFAGELIDRMLFYNDFDPVNIRTSIDKYLNTAKDEKKNG